VDIDFVRKAVRSIGRLAIKVEQASDQCTEALLSLIETKVTYVVQEAVIVIKDVFRRYPGKYEGIIPTLCENLDALDEPESKSAMIWIVGQFANKIDNADELLDDLLYTFMDESVEVWPI
jgi:AP-2 complex subunit beta-1